MNEGRLHGTVASVGKMQGQIAPAWLEPPGARHKESDLPMHDERTDIPYGYCHCGCGQQTERWTCSNRPRGRIKGEPARYVHGHHRRGLISNHAAIKWIEADRGYVTPCWIWQLEMSYDGYGRKWLGQRRVHAHRWAYEQHIGPIPEGLQLDHLCRVRACVNPHHLEPVTAWENTQRGLISRGLRPARDHG